MGRNSKNLSSSPSVLDGGGGEIRMRKKAKATPQKIARMKREMKNEREKDFKRMANTVEEWGSASSIHGVQYTVESQQGVLHQLFWTLCIIFFAALAIYFSITAVTDRLEFPVLTSVHSTGGPIESLPFPSISICSQGSIDKIFDNVMWYQFTEYVKENNLKLNISNMSETERKEGIAKMMEANYPGGGNLVKLISQSEMAPTMDAVGESLVMDDGLDSAVCDVQLTNVTISDFNFTVTSSQVCGDDVTWVLVNIPMDPGGPFSFEQSCWKLINDSATNVRGEPNLCDEEGGSIIKFDNIVKASAIGEIGNSADPVEFWFHSSDESSPGNYTFRNKLKFDTIEGVFYESDEPDYLHNTSSPFPPLDQSSSLYGETSLPPGLCTVMRIGGGAPLTYDYKNCTDLAIFMCTKKPKVPTVCFDGVQNDRLVSHNAIIERNLLYNSFLGFGEEGTFSFTTHTTLGRKKREAVDSGAGSSSPKGFKLTEKARAKKLKKIGLFLDPRNKVDRIFDQVAEEAKIRKRFASMDMEKSYKHIFELLYYGRLPCFDVKGITSKTNNQYSLVKKCVWKGVTVPCTALFKKFPTENGICCSFNIEDVDEIFKKKDFSEVMSHFHERDKNKSFETYNEKDIENLDFTPETGRSNGLQLVLDAHTNLLAARSVSEDFAGFTAFVGESHLYPQSSRRPILIRPGHINLVAIEATRIEASPNIKSVDKHKRQCLFSDEVELKAHRRYAQASCRLECAIESVNESQRKGKLSEDSVKVLSKLASNETVQQFLRELEESIEAIGTSNSVNRSVQCVPWNLPPLSNSTRMCDPVESKDFINEFKKPKNCSQCLPDCEEVIYKTTVTASPFRKCNFRNLGVSQMCTLETSKALTEPAIWGQDVLNEYTSKGSIIPDHISKAFVSNARVEVPLDEAGNAFFTSSVDQYIQEVDDSNVKEVQYYDAYQKDIAVVDFFFDSPTHFIFVRQSRITIPEMISQVGGILGLSLGFSLISLVELIYWICYRLPRRMFRS